MNNRKKIFIIIASLICLLSLCVFGVSLMNLIQKQYITGGFYTLEGLISIIVISGLIAIVSIGLIIFKFKRK